MDSEKSTKFEYLYELPDGYILSVEWRSGISIIGFVLFLDRITKELKMYIGVSDRSGILSERLDTIRVKERGIKIRDSSFMFSIFKNYFAKHIGEPLVTKAITCCEEPIEEFKLRFLDIKQNVTGDRDDEYDDIE